MEKLRNNVVSPVTPFSELKSDDLDVALKVIYVGSEDSATITVSAAGDITFKHGDAGSEAVDATIDSGGDDEGVIDVSDTTADTFGEVIDMINASPNWKAWLVGSLRADSSNNSTGSLLARSETTLAPFSASPAGTTQEVSLYKDTSKVLELAVRVSSKQNVSGSEDKNASEIYSITSLNTFGSGTNTIKIYEIDERAKTETLVYSKAGGETTVEDTKSFVQEGRGSFATKGIGKSLLVKMVGSAACTGSLQVIGAVDKGM